VGGGGDWEAEKRRAGREPGGTPFRLDSERILTSSSGHNVGWTVQEQSRWRW